MRKVFLLLSVLVLCACNHPMDPVPKYHVSDFVRSVLNDQRGQVTQVSCFSQIKVCYYDVRFANTTTPVRAMFPVVMLYEYEIKDDK